ncbi:MAG: two-component system response regulator LytT, partial [Polaribacter sp.]
MKSLIIDDDATARLIVNKLCSNVDEVEVVEEFSNAIDAIKFLNSNTVDVIFLDIHMPSFSGFDFIKTLKDPPKVILITSDRNFALDAFEYDCVVDYLVKPIDLERFKKSIDKLSAFKNKQLINAIQPSSESSVNDLYVNIDRRLIKINIPDIYLIEAKGDYIKIKTENTNHIVHSTLKKIERKLPHDMFLK